MHDAFQITEVGLQARNLVLVKYPAHTFYGILAGRSPYNQLAYHRVVIDGNLVTFVNVAVNAYADAVRLRQLFDDTRRRHEVVLRVFRTDTTFDGMTALEKFFLLQVQHLVIGYTDLFFYQIHAHHFFGDGMLHLQTGVHLQKIEIAVLVHQKLDSSGSRIVHRPGGSHCLFPHLLAEFRSKERRRALLYNLLVATLDRTLAVKQMDYIAMIVTQNLKFYMMGFLHKFFQINRIIPERRHGLGTGGVICLHHFIFTVYQPHPFTAASHRSLQHDRIAYFITDTYRLFGTLQRLFRTGDYGNTCGNHTLTGGNLVTHRFHRLGGRTDKDDPLLFAPAGKISILGQKTITGMNGIGFASFGSLYYFFYI